MMARIMQANTVAPQRAEIVPAPAQSEAVVANGLRRLVFGPSCLTLMHEECGAA